MARRCYECGRGMLVLKQIEYAQHGVKLGKFPAEVCSRCEEQFFSTETSSKIERAAKRAKVWGLYTTTRVGQTGNALDVRIAKPLAHFVGLQKGDEVVVHPEGKKRLVIELE